MSNIRGLMANAACIGAEVRALRPDGDIASHYDEIIDASLALGEIEAMDSFSWDDAPIDWESACYKAAGLIVMSVNTDWGDHFRASLQIKVVAL